MARVIAQAGNQTIGIKVNRPSWADMYRNYPNESITSKQFYPMISDEYAKLANKPNSNYNNTCAARMSYALNRSGIKLPKNGGGTWLGKDGFYYWIRVRELKQFLRNRFKNPDFEYTPQRISVPFTNEQLRNRTIGIRQNILNKIQGKHGIIVFDVDGWSDASGHFTLWDGSNLVYVGPGDHNNPNSTEYYFWLIRNPDERKRITQTIKISFWELK
jgi:hypothetical protein